MLPEEPMLLNKGAGARTPMALPDGTAKVRFFASQDGTISVDLRKQAGDLVRCLRKGIPGPA
jgi:hypothetical protein